MKKLLIFTAIALAYYLLAFVGLELASVNKLSSPIWPASGLAIGALAIFGRNFTLSILLGSFFINYLNGASALPAIFISSGNALEAWIASTILLEAGKRRSESDYFELIFLPLGALIGAAVSATIGNLTLLTLVDLPKESFLISWYTWFSGNAIGSLIVAPLFLESVFPPKSPVLKRGFLRPLAAALVMCSLILVIFLNNYNEAFAWAFGITFVLSGIYFGRTFARFMLILTSIPVVVLTVKGYGPFELGSFNEDLIYIQMLLFSYALAVYFIQPLTTSYRISWKYLNVLFFGWLCTFIAVYSISRNESQRLIGDFKDIVEASLDNLRETSRRYEAMLYSAEAFIKMNPKLTSEDWKNFYENQRTNEFFDSIEAIVLIDRVKKKDLPSYLKRHNLKLRILDEEYSRRQNDHFIARYIEPFEPNKNVPGLDAGSERTRREAIELSREFNHAVATRTIYLVQDLKNRKSFNLLKTMVDKNGTAVGTVHLPMINENFYGTVFKRFDKLMRVGVALDGESIYQARDERERDVRKEYVVREKRKFFGRDYEFEFYPTSKFFLNYSGQSSTIALLLNFFLLLISAFLLEQLTSGQKAEQLVQERTKELETSKLQLMQTAKMASLGEMASSMAHEINNPLTIILGKLNVIHLVLQDQKVTNPIVNEEISKIKTNVDRIDRIIKGLKNFSRSSSQDPFELCSIRDIISETLDLCLSRIRKSHIRLTVEEIPNIFISCRQGQISQVLVNLLNNSRDAIEDLPEKWIEVSFETIEEKTLKIIVTDSGPGILPDLAAHIMSPFFTTKPRNKGTGLGLSISKNIVEVHGGKISVDHSYPNTRFVVELPIA